MTKGNEAENGKSDWAVEILDEAKPLLLRALVKCGHIPTEPYRDPQLSPSEFVLAVLREKPGGHDEYFRELARDGRSWRELRHSVDVVACKLSTLAKRHKLDPCVALRTAFLMRIGGDHPLGPLDVSAIVDLAALVSLLVELEEAKQAKPKAKGTPSADAMFAGRVVLDELDLAIVHGAMDAATWLKTTDLRLRVKPWKFHVGGRHDKNNEAWRKRVAKLCLRGYLVRNKPQGKMVQWTGKQP